MPEVYLLYVLVFVNKRIYYCTYISLFKKGPFIESYMEILPRVSIRRHTIKMNRSIEFQLYCHTAQVLSMDQAPLVTQGIRKC